jgi:hypothetical protein
MRRALLVALLSAVVAAWVTLAASARADDEPPMKLWDGKTPLRCTADQVMAVEGRKVHLSGTAVSASGRCQITLTDCSIDADVAIRASGHAKVTIVHSALQGRDAAIVASGSAVVALENTKTDGAIRKSGSAKVTK